MASASVKVSIQGADGCCTEIHVESGSTVSQILDQETLRLPAGYRARLVSETAEILEPDSRVWEPQVRVSQTRTHSHSILNRDSPQAFCIPTYPLSPRKYSK